MIRKALISVVLLSMVGCGGSDDSSIDDSASALSAAKSAVENSIDDLIGGAQPIVDEFVVLPLAGRDADRELRRLAELPSIVDALTLDDRAVVQAIQPEEYGDLLGVVLNDPAHVARMAALSAPLLSEYFLALENVRAIALEFPLHVSASTYKGSVSLLIDLVSWLGRISRSALGGSRYGMTVLQLDGVVLWDESPELIGKNVFTDPVFNDNPDFARQAQEVAAAEEGTGSYVWTAGSSTPLESACVWSTIRRAGVEWRVMVFWPE